MNEKSKDNKTNESIFADVMAQRELKVWVFILVTIFLVVVFWGLVYWVRSSNMESNFGMYGDFLGGVFGAVASVLTLYLLLATVFFTHRTMKVAELNLEMTRNELQDTKKEMERQNFDSKMFFLIKAFMGVRDSLDYNGSRLGSKTISSAFSDSLQKALGNTHESATKLEIERIVNMFSSKLKDAPYVAPYFSSLVAVMNLIDGLSEEDDALRNSAALYKQVLASVLTDYEVTALFLYSRSKDVEASLRDTVDEFLFENVICGRSGLIKKAIPNMKNTLAT